MVPDAWRRAHDVRFVEDNWESPVLGAWGLGWEVWLDGMEVTQFTYFQQAGSQTLPKVAVEITYGLERIIMNLQNVKHFKDIRYTDALTYGELFMQNEYEVRAAAASLRVSDRLSYMRRELGPTPLLPVGFGFVSKHLTRLAGEKRWSPRRCSLSLCCNTPRMAARHERP